MRKHFAAILETTFYVGVADLLLAIVQQYVATGAFPDRLLKYIAGGFLGMKNAMAGGTGTELLGLFIHFSICFCFCAFYFWIYRFVQPLAQNIVISGLFYAVFVNLTMGFLILPLTGLPQSGEFLLTRAFLNWVLLGLVLGIPIAYFARRHFSHL